MLCVNGCVPWPGVLFTVSADKNKLNAGTFFLLLGPCSSLWLVFPSGIFQQLRIDAMIIIPYTEMMTVILSMIIKTVVTMWP